MNLIDNIGSNEDFFYSELMRTLRIELFGRKASVELFKGHTFKKLQRRLVEK